MLTFEPNGRLHNSRKNEQRPFSGSRQTAIGDHRGTDGALKCAATKATSKPTATAARFDEPEPAATNSSATAKQPAGRRRYERQRQRRPPKKAGGRYKVKGNVKSAHPAQAGCPLQSQNPNSVLPV